MKNTAFEQTKSGEAKLKSERAIVRYELSIEHSKKANTLIRNMKKSLGLKNA